jgi:hypothetical protein
MKSLAPGVQIGTHVCLLSSCEVGKGHVWGESTRAHQRATPGFPGVTPSVSAPWEGMHQGSSGLVLKDSTLEGNPVLECNTCEVPWCALCRAALEPSTNGFRCHTIFLWYGAKGERPLAMWVL